MVKRKEVTSASITSASNTSASNDGEIAIDGGAAAQCVTHDRIMNELKRMSAAEILARSVEAGIHNKDGTLTARYATRVPKS